MIKFYPINPHIKILPAHNLRPVVDSFEKAEPKKLCTVFSDGLIPIVKSYTGEKYGQTNRGIKKMLAIGTYPASFFRDVKDKTILDVGTGGGQFVLDLNAKGANALGIDIAPHENFKKYPKNFLIADAADTKLPAKSFDIIYSAWSVLSLSDSRAFRTKVLTELKRILKDDGKIRLGCVDNSDIEQIVKDIGGLKFSVNTSCVDFCTLRGWVELVKKH